MSDNDKIACEMCGEKIHAVKKHLQQVHPSTTVEDYQEAYPDAPLMSEVLRAAVEKKAQERREAQQRMVGMVAKTIPGSKFKANKVPVHEVFEMPLTEGLRGSARTGQSEGRPIECDVYDTDSMDAADVEAIPEIDEGYVFKEDELKDCLMAIQLGMPLLVWGLHGTGKTTSIQQICARTNRPCIRVQHTGTTEEAHIIGQMAVRDGATVFDYGPLAEAMMRGWTYLADEYDFADPSVNAVYQPVLEGAPLYIKEAPPAQRLIKPHPNFRFVATGNTNGSGDDTGLYSGTRFGNAAAYSRFITVRISYPDPEVEMAILKTRLHLTADLAEKLVEFATSTREMYEKGELSLPISPRELIRAATIAALKGGKFRKGIELAYSNRLDRIQGESVSQTAQRIFAS